MQKKKNMNFQEFKKDDLDKKKIERRAFLKKKKRDKKRHVWSLSWQRE